MRALSLQVRRKGLLLASQQDRYATLVENGCISVWYFDFESKSLGVFYPEVDMVVALGVAPNADVLAIDHLKRNFTQHRVGTYRHAVIYPAEERQFQLCLIPWDENCGVVVFILDVPVERGQTILFGKGAALRRTSGGKQSYRGEQEDGVLHRDSHYAHWTSWLRTAVTALEMFSSVSSLAVYRGPPPRRMAPWDLDTSLLASALSTAAKASTIG